MSDLEKINSLVNQAKSSKKSTPIQRVKLVSKKQVKETQISVYLEDKLLKKLKLKALHRDCSYKQIIHEALEYHLNQKKS